MEKYIITTPRLGFRGWQDSDLEEMYKLNSDKDVMEFFPNNPSKAQTMAFIQRMKKEYEAKNFCYFAVDKLSNQEFIGFIGISEKDFEADFTPCIDIGWRLKKSEWNKGLATEGAKACLNYAFSHLNIKHIYAIAPAINTKSELVMRKIGMKMIKTFIHPLLLNHERLRECVLYETKAVQ